MFTSEELGVMMEALQAKYGFGYSDAVERGVKIGALQAKLSVMAEMAAKRSTRCIKTDVQDKPFAVIGRTPLG